jgi:DNA end-binding protein Ku
MRPLWKGSISFGLVNIPIKMYTASHEHEIKFVMLHKKDLSQVRYARICKEEEKEIPWEEIVKGYEYSPGEFIVINEADFDKINLKKSQSIEIIHFIHQSEIDTIYYAKPYFLEPDKNADKAYRLLLEAMQKSKKVGIAKFVLHHREHLAVIKPYEDAIILNELRYDAELSKIKEIDVPKEGKAAPQELAIAMKLIDHLTVPFKAKEYVDTYAEEAMEMINQKAKGKKVHPKGQEKKPSKVQNIMSLLKASLEEQPKKRKTGS